MAPPNIIMSSASSSTDIPSEAQRYSSNDFMKQIDEILVKKGEGGDEDDDGEGEGSSLHIFLSPSKSDDTSDEQGEILNTSQESFDSTMMEGAKDPAQTETKGSTTEIDLPSSPSSNNNKSQRSVKVKFSGMEGPSPPPGINLEEASRSELIQKLGGLQERLTQTQVDLKKEKSERRRKEKNIFKMAKELSKRQAESTQKEEDIVKVGT